MIIKDHKDIVTELNIGDVVKSGRTEWVIFAKVTNTTGKTLYCGQSGFKHAFFGINSESQVFKHI